MQSGQSNMGAALEFDAINRRPVKTTPKIFFFMANDPQYKKPKINPSQDPES
jgi:hypothetical protein